MFVDAWKDDDIEDELAPPSAMRTQQSNLRSGSTDTGDSLLPITETHGTRRDSTALMTAAAAAGGLAGASAVPRGSGQHGAYRLQDFRFPVSLAGSMSGGFSRAQPPQPDRTGSASAPSHVHNPFSLPPRGGAIATLSSDDDEADSDGSELLEEPFDGELQSPATPLISLTTMGAADPNRHAAMFSGAPMALARGKNNSETYDSEDAPPHQAVETPATLPNAAPMAFTFSMHGANTGGGAYFDDDNEAVEASNSSLTSSSFKSTSRAMSPPLLPVGTSASTTATTTSGATNGGGVLTGAAGGSRTSALAVSADLHLSSHSASVSQLQHQRGSQSASHGAPSAADLNALASSSSGNGSNDAASTSGIHNRAGSGGNSGNLAAAALGSSASSVLSARHRHHHQHQNSNQYSQRSRRQSHTSVESAGSVSVKHEHAMQQITGASLGPNNVSLGIDSPGNSAAIIDFIQTSSSEAQYMLRPHNDGVGAAMVPSFRDRMAQRSPAMH